MVYDELTQKNELALYAVPFRDSQNRAIDIEPDKGRRSFPESTIYVVARNPYEAFGLAVSCLEKDAIISSRNTLTAVGRVFISSHGEFRLHKKENLEKVASELISEDNFR